MDAMFALAREPREEDQLALADAVAAVAERTGLGAPPRVLAGEREWDAWWRASREGFAGRLGRLQAPAHLDLDGIAARGTFCGAGEEQGAPDGGKAAGAGGR